MKLDILTITFIMAILLLVLFTLVLRNQIKLVLAPTLLFMFLEFYGGIKIVFIMQILIFIIFMGILHLIQETKHEEQLSFISIGVGFLSLLFYDLLFVPIIM